MLSAGIFGALANISFEFVGLAKYCTFSTIFQQLVCDADKKSPVLNGGDNGPAIEATSCSTVANNVESETSSGDCNENRWEQVRSRNRTVFNSAVSSVAFICSTNFIQVPM